MAAKSKPSEAVVTGVPTVTTTAPLGPPPKAPKKPKMVHEVVQEGSTITLRGTDVQMQALSAEQQATYGIKTVEGVMGQPCAEPLVLRFKSPKAAEDFFAMCFNLEDEATSFIDAGGKTDWMCEDMSRMM